MITAVDQISDLTKLDDAAITLYNAKLILTTATNPKLDTLTTTHIPALEAKIKTAKLQMSSNKAYHFVKKQVLTSLNQGKASDPLLAGITYEQAFDTLENVLGNTTTYAFDTQQTDSLTKYRNLSQNMHEAITELNANNFKNARKLLSTAKAHTSYLNTNEIKDLIDEIPKFEKLIDDQETAVIQAQNTTTPANTTTNTTTPTTNTVTNTTTLSNTVDADLHKMGLQVVKGDNNLFTLQDLN